MRTFICITFFALQVAVLHAQRKNTIPDVQREVDSLVAYYDFTRATELLESRIEALEKKKKESDSEQQQLEAIARMQMVLRATEDIVIVDSIVVDKDKFLSKYSLGTECGSIAYTSDWLEGKDTLGLTSFCNQMGNQRILSMTTDKVRARLYSSNQIGGNWTKPEPLAGLGDDTMQNFPFMLNDGITLYYSAINEQDGLGGYDIFMTRYDADNKTFLSPENIGMPFNSSSNDYMFAVDEFNSLGWFATDRFQPRDRVCIYIFIPNQTRHIYNEEVLGTDKLARLARIASIKETWRDMAVVQQAKDRLARLTQDAPYDGAQHDFEFVVNDKTTYTTLTQFRSQYGKANARWWKENTEDLLKTRVELSALRDKFAYADQATKQRLTPQIRILEAKAEQLLSAAREMEKKIRNEENKP